MTDKEFTDGEVFNISNALTHVQATTDITRLSKELSGTIVGLNPKAMALFTQLATDKVKHFNL